MTSQVDISVVIPAYNEAHILPLHLSRLLPIMEEVAGCDWEVFIVDDGSQEDLAAVVASLGLPRQVKVLRSAWNRGKGASIRTGVAATTGHMVLTCDADMATPPETLISFMAALDAGADIVIGNRRSTMARIERAQPWPRRMLGNSFLALCQVLTGVRLRDYNCGFKLFRGQVARDIMAETRTDRWVIDMESLALAARRNLSIVELPVTWRDGERTAVRLSRDIIATLCEMLRISWRLRFSGTDGCDSGHLG